MAVIDTTRPPKISTRPGKEKVVAEVVGLLEKSNLVFSLPSSRISGNQVVALRKGLPDGCTAKVVKNKLMRIACKGTAFEELAEITTGENFWMFVEGEENLAAPIKYIAEFSKGVDAVRHRDFFLRVFEAAVRGVGRGVRRRGRGEQKRACTMHAAAAVGTAASHTQRRHLIPCILLALPA